MSGVDPSSLNYTPLVPYNGSIATGGDSMGNDLNVFYQVSLVRRCPGMNEWMSTME